LDGDVDRGASADTGGLAREHSLSTKNVETLERAVEASREGEG